MSLEDRLEAIQKSMAQACHRVKRDPSQVRLLAVSKMQPDALIEEAYALGVRDFGENYVQELQRKKAAFSHLSDIRWHLIGALQTNKVKMALACADFFHALDSDKLLLEIHKRNQSIKPWPVFIEINIDGQASKAGILAEDVPAFVMKVLEQPSVTLQGLMAIPEPKATLDEMRPAFIAMRDLRNYLQTHCGRSFELSMGMSEDFEIAIEEGANWVRVGRKLFGDRHSA